MRRCGAFSAAMLAVVVVAATATAAPSPRLTVDLGSGAIDGHVVLGRSPAQVTRSLGRPSWRLPGTRLYRVGYGERTNFRLMVRFRKQGGTFRAVAVTFERPPLLEKQIGRNVLAMTPGAFQNEVARTYGAGFTIKTRLHCVRQLCSVTLQSSDSGRSVTFGTTKALGTFLTVWVAS